MEEEKKERLYLLSKTHKAIAGVLLKMLTIFAVSIHDVKSQRPAALPRATCPEPNYADFRNSKHTPDMSLCPKERPSSLRRAGWHRPSPTG